MVRLTSAAVRLAFDTFLKAAAGPKDTVLVFVASHGTVDPQTREGFVVTYDSDPQDLVSTALPMADLQKLIREELSGVKRVHVYVDVCHAGKIGTIEAKKNRINSVIERLGEADGEILGLMASRPREVSYAGPQFGGGHGAFSYFLLNTLNGAADYDQDGLVVVDDVIDYVREKVAEGTWPKTPKIYPRALAWPERYPVAGKAPKRSGCTPRSSRPFRTTWPPASPWRSYTKNRAIPRRRLNSSIRRARANRKTLSSLNRSEISSRPVDGRHKLLMPTSPRYTMLRTGKRKSACGGSESGKGVFFSPGD